MNKMYPEYLDSGPSARLVAADVLLRKEPAEEEEEEDEDEEVDDRNDDDTDDGEEGDGYSE